MKNRFDKLIAMALASLTLALPGTLSARERRGANIVVTLKDGHYIGGELITVKPDSLLLLNPALKDESVDLVGIRNIRIVRKSKALLGAAYGALAGTLIISMLVALDNPYSEHGAWPVIGSGLFFGATPGGLIGFGAGALAGGKDKTIQLEGKSESEVGKALAYLRSKARIRDYE